MKRSPEELAQTERFEQKYKNSQSGVMLSIERQVCGCDYGGNSWTTRGQAQNIESLLGLKPGFRFLDLGAGSGWPGLYLAKSSGCDLMLVDLPMSGLKIAAERAISDQMTGACWIACANATRLPFRNSCFDAISHSDLLCCLKQKRDVLESCSRVLRKGGRMVFTVISMAANLSQAERENTLATAPEYVESGIDYLTMLEQSGWSVIDNQDLSAAYAASCHRQVKAMKENKDDYIAINGASDYGDRLTRYASKFSALEEGRLRRELFVAKTI
jgi:ubiquinone/menaquinone biosynthesis C-methylase UbiE